MGALEAGWARQLMARVTGWVLVARKKALQSGPMAMVMVLRHGEPGVRESQAVMAPQNALCLA